MQKQENNYAFIDSQNALWNKYSWGVNLAIRDQGWKLNWKKF